MSAPVVTLQDKVLWNDLLILVDCVRNNEIEVGVAVDRGPEMIAAHREAAQADARASCADDGEAYEIGVRDGREEAFAIIDGLTGGDGEYFASTVRNDCRDEDAMRDKVVKRFAEAQAEIAALERACIDVGASLAAAISLLERGGKAAKKAAPSDKMFDQMLRDYNASLERARAALARHKAGAQ